MNRAPLVLATVLILGGLGISNATEEIARSKTPHNFLQGTAEKEIGEGWIYELKGLAREDRSVFDKDGKVLKSNSGSG